MPAAALSSHSSSSSTSSGNGGLKPRPARPGSSNALPTLTTRPPALIALAELSKAAATSHELSSNARANLGMACQAAAVVVKECGCQLSSADLADLGLSIGGSVIALSGQNSLAEHRNWHADLVKATIAAALNAPAMQTASINQWSDQLYGLAKAEAQSGASSQPASGLHALMTHAQHHMTHEVWLTGRSSSLVTKADKVAALVWAYATVHYEGNIRALVSEASSSFVWHMTSADAHQRPDAQAVSNITWGLATLGCQAGKDLGVTPLLTSIVEYVKQGGMQSAQNLAWQNLLWGLARCKCRVQPISPGGETVDAGPAVVAAVGVLQKNILHAVPQQVSNIVWALTILGCRTGQVGQPDIRPLLISIVRFVQQGGLDGTIAQHWSNTLWGLAKYGCSMQPITPGQHAVNVRPVVEAAIRELQGRVLLSAKPQEVANAVLALGSMGCTMTSRPSISPLLPSVLEYVRQEGLRGANLLDFTQLLLGLAKAQADKVTVQPIVHVLMLGMPGLVRSGKADVPLVKDLVSALVYFGMLDAKDQLLHRLPPVLLASYKAEGRT